MQAIEIIGTALLVMAVAMGGAYMGTVMGSAGDVEQAPALISLTRTVELQPVSVPVYERGARIGYCVVTAHVELPNSFSDEEFQITMAQVADELIRTLSMVDDGQDAEAICQDNLDTTVGGGKVVDVSFYRTIRSVPGTQ